MTAELGVDGLAVGAANGKEERDRRPEDGFLRPAKTLPLDDAVEIDGDEQHDRRREGSRPRQEADGNEYAAEELGRRKQGRPENARIEPKPSTMPAAPKGLRILP